MTPAALPVEITHIFLRISFSAEVQGQEPMISQAPSARLAAKTGVKIREIP